MANWVWVVAGVVAFIGSLVGLMMRPARIRIAVTGTHLVVEPLGLDKIWCVRTRVTVPLEKVASIESAERYSLPQPGLRLPGSYFPGVIIAGSYGLGENRSFWDARRASRLLVVNCRPDAAYRRLVLEVPDPRNAAVRLQEQLRQSQR